MVQQKMCRAVGKELQKSNFWNSGHILVIWKEDNAGKSPALYQHTQKEASRSDHAGYGALASHRFVPFLCAKNK